MHDTGQGRLENSWVGSPKDIADRLEEWFPEWACDGFVAGPTYLPGTFEEFVRLVIPELQRRGVYRNEYTGTTRRDHLGLARPEVGVWRH
jgi:alkanesulfonate monooxygenase SsuD/methylene tetrahydromethanopterin reductase-like flavin-dependent oxidoreductase (luciferase family)